MTVPRPRATGLAAMAAAVGLSAWLLATHDESAATPTSEAALPPAQTATTETPPQGILTESQLRAEARRLGQVPYWAGPRADRRYGLRRDPQNGAIAVYYYLPQGDQELTVVTIPLADAFVKTEELAAQPGAVRHELAGGGVAWSPGDRPGTAYVAYPGVDHVVELDAEQPGLAREVAFAAQVRPLE